jgi:hypothetical protein
VDLATGWLRVAESKTDAGIRRVKIRGALAREIRAASVRGASVSTDAYVFPTSRDGPQSEDNFRSRVLKAAVERANQNLARGTKPRLSRVLSMGDPGFEPGTSSLSEKRSNRLS